MNGLRLVVIIGGCALAIITLALGTPPLRWELITADVVCICLALEMRYKR